jgi:hypothetical protein
MLTLNVTNRIIMKITVWLIPTRQRFDNCLLKKFNYSDDSVFYHFNVTMKTKLTLHGEILGVRYFFEIKCISKKL